MQFKMALGITLLALVLGAVGTATLFLLGGGSDESERVARASDAANAAMQSRQFEALHEMLSREIQDGTTPAALQAKVEEAEAALGRIVAVGRVGEPVVKGQTAVVETEVTYELGGQRTIRQFYDLYVLQDGQWRLVYSQPKESVQPASTPVAGD
jgi:hypothetical protein